MKLSDFREDLKKAGVSFRLFYKEYLKQGQDSKAFRSLVERGETSDFVLNQLTWKLTSQGWEYWNKKYLKLKINNIKILSEEGDVLSDYSITLIRRTKDLRVGCQSITPKQQLKLFKLLGKQLGYKIEG